MATLTGFRADRDGAFIDKDPDTKCRFSVLGFVASMSLSIIRFNAMAKPLAPIAATRIHMISTPNIGEEIS